MTIHHDKLAYGKLASMREEMSEEKLLKMLQALSAEGEGKEDGHKKQEKTAPAEKDEKGGK